MQTNNLQSIAVRELDELIERYRGSGDAQEMREIAFELEELLQEDASFVPGFYAPKHRTGYWRWVKWPEGFHVELSRSSEQYFLYWLDPEAKRETLDAKRGDTKYAPSIRVYDQYARP